MDAPEEATHPFALVLRAEFGPLPAAAREEREAEARMVQQRACVPVASEFAGPARKHHRRDDRNLGGRQLQREVVLLENRLVAPASRPVELRDDRLAALDADLVDAVLVAAERKDPPIAQQAGGIDRIEDHVRRQPVERMSHRGAGSGIRGFRPYSPSPSAFISTASAQRSGSIEITFCTPESRPMR